MSSRALRVPLVALVATAVVAVGIVFFVLRRGSESGLVYEGEIPVVDKDEIPVFTAEVSTVSVPIKADFAALASKIRDEAMDMNAITGNYRIIKEVLPSWLGWLDDVSTVIFYYTADLISLDVSLGDGSLFAASTAPKLRGLEQMKDASKGPMRTAIERQLEQLTSEIEAVAERPVIEVKGKISLCGSIQNKYFDKKITKFPYDGIVQFSKKYIVGLDESAKLTIDDYFGEQMNVWGRIADLSLADQDNLLTKYIVPRIRDTIDDALNKKIKVFNDETLSLLYEQGWNALQPPIKLTDEVWLVLHPEELEVAQLSSSGTMLETAVTVLARPKVILGDKPQLPEVPPRPPVRLGETEGGVHVVVDAIVPLGEAERLLNKELGGLEKVIYSQGKVKVKVPKARIYSCENCLRLELLLTKPFQGSLFLEGAPRYDAENNELYVDGLDFTVDTKNLLAKPLARSASWLLERPLLKDYLQTKVRLPVGGPLANVGKAISQYDGEEIAEGMVLRLGDTSFKMLCVYNTPEAMHLIVQADGSAEVTMN